MATSHIPGRITFTSFIGLGDDEDVEVSVVADLSRADAWEGGGTVVEFVSITTTDGTDVLGIVPQRALGWLEEEAVQEAADADEAARDAADDAAYERRREDRLSN